MAQRQSRLIEEDDGSSIGELIRELGRSSADLVRNEVALARREIVDALAEIRRGLAFVLVGSILAVASLFWLTVSARDTLASYMAGSQAALVVGLALGVGAGFTVWTGLRRPRQGS